MTSVHIIFDFLGFYSSKNVRKGIISIIKWVFVWEFEWKSWKRATWRQWLLHFPSFTLFFPKTVCMLRISSENPHLCFVLILTKVFKHFSSKFASYDSVCNEETWLCKKIGYTFFEKMDDFSSQLGMIKYSEIRHFSMKFPSEGEFWHC